MKVLSNVVILQHYEIRGKRESIDEIEAACYYIKNSKIDNLATQLKQTPGVVSVVVNSTLK
jgi:hypothetical protein